MKNKPYQIALYGEGTKPKSLRPCIDFLLIMCNSINAPVELFHANEEKDKEKDEEKDDTYSNISLKASSSESSLSLQISNLKGIASLTVATKKAFKQSIITKMFRLYFKPMIRTTVKHQFPDIPEKITEEGPWIDR